MKIFLIIWAVSTSMFAQSQTWEEWFQQKKTKLKYIEEQIAALEIYASDLKKGYEIADKGWNVINDIKHGDFDLHNDYFNSLKSVNSSITGYNKINAITTLQLQILQVDDSIKKFIEDNEYIQEQEKNYIDNVQSNLLNKCAADIDQLKTLTTNDSLEMKDDERLRHIDGLYVDMLDKYAFDRHFEGVIQTLSLGRQKELNDAGTIKLLYGIK